MHLHNHYHRCSPPPCFSSHPPIHWPLSSLHSSSSSFHRWAHSACSISQQPRRVGVIPAVPGGAVAGPPTRFHLPLLAPRSGNLQTYFPSPSRHHLCPPHLLLSPFHKQLSLSALKSLSAPSTDPPHSTHHQITLIYKFIKELKNLVTHLILSQTNWCGNYLLFHFFLKLATIIVTYILQTTISVTLVSHAHLQRRRKGIWDNSICALIPKLVTL